MKDAALASPLRWPPGQPRTPPWEQKMGRFRSQIGGHASEGYAAVSLGGARDRLDRELGALGAVDPMLSSNLLVRVNGQLRAGQAEPVDSGVAVYFSLKGKSIVLACDRWFRVADNVAAVAGHIGALRAQDRWGVGTLDQAFAGFLALPAPSAEPPLPGWRELLGDPADLAAAKAAWRTLSKQVHQEGQPDQHERAVALNAAMAEAKLHFTGSSRP